MAITVATAGTAQAKSGTSLVSSGTFTPAVNDYVIAVVAADTDVVCTLSVTNNEAILDATTQPITATNSGNVLVSVNIAKVVSLSAMVWYSGGNLGTARSDLAGCGTQASGLSFGGYTTTSSAVTEEYDGAAWASGGNLGTARYGLAGCGTQTAGLSFSGYRLSPDAYSAVTEEYDGAAWASGGNIGTARIDLAGCGTQTAGLSFGGNTGVRSAVTEEYDGAAWASGGNLSAVKDRLAGSGTQTAGLSFGGVIITRSATTEEYDGASWSSGGSLSSERADLGGAGTQSAGLSFGGSTNSLTISGVTEEYNGTAWSSGVNLGTARIDLAGCGTQTAGLCFGGDTTGSGNYTASTEEYNSNTYSASTITISGLADESHAVAFYVAKGLATSSPYDKGSTGTGGSTTPSSGASATLAQADNLIIGGIGIEGPGDDTAGSWTTGTSNVSGNEQRLGTTGGGAASNITVNAAAEVVSATTAQTAAMSGITSRDWAALVAAFKGAASAGYFIPRKTYHYMNH